MSIRGKLYLLGKNLSTRGKYISKRENIIWIKYRLGKHHTWEKTSTEVKYERVEKIIWGKHQYSGKISTGVNIIGKKYQLEENMKLREIINC